MFYILLFIIKVTFMPLDKLKKEFAVKFLLTLKELEICKRKLEVNNKRIRFTNIDRLLYAVFKKISSKIDFYISLVKPETVLNWYKNFIKKFWIFPNKNKKKRGRPETPEEVKKLILKMKNENIRIGYSKIVGELLKLGITIDETTVRKIINDYRKDGKVKTGLTWKTFIKSILNLYMLWISLL
jgi:putative transposase